MLDSKLRSIDDALDMIDDGDKIAISAVGIVGYPEYIVKKLEERFLETGHPAGLTLYAAGGHGLAGQPDFCDGRFAHPGFLSRYVCTHPMSVPKVRDLIVKNEFEAYALPQGIMNQLYRSAAAKQPGILSKIGMGTYVDPRSEGGKLNEISNDELSRMIELDGEQWIFYKSFPVTVALIRGTYADEKGNVTIDREALKMEMLECAMAAKASGGKVIVQVEKVVEKHSLPAKNVVVPGQLVDAVVIAEEQEIYHRQYSGIGHNPYLSGEARGPKGELAKPKTVLSMEDVICRRAVFEVSPGDVVNLGIGLGAGVGEEAAIEGITEEIDFTIELGAFGGTPLAPPLFGTAKNPESYISPPSMFDYYHGGNLDLTVLGAAQVDKAGNVNVSKFGGNPNGHGGFIDISSSAKKVLFCFTMMAKGLQTQVEDGRMKILQEGKIRKFVDEVEQITFNAQLAVQEGHEIYYITERAVFKREKDYVALIEVAPGIDLEKDVLANMGFRPVICENLKVMDERIFRPGKMGLRQLK